MEKIILVLLILVLLMLVPIQSQTFLQGDISGMILTPDT